MAEIEWQQSVCATYMVLIPSRLYDLQSLHSRRALAELTNAGHEVALHFDISDDARRQDLGIDEVVKEIDKSCEILQGITGIPIRTISFHRPTPRFLRGPLLVSGRVNAYAAELMNNYISDSRGCWSKDPLIHLNGQVLDSTVSQLLVHPIWWGHEHKLPEARLLEFFERETKHLSCEQKKTFDHKLTATIPGVRRAILKEES